MTLVPTQGTAVEQGPGHDVAVLSSGGRVAVSTDALVEGVHFLRATSSPEDVGWKALAAALSDLAAARSRPLGTVISLTVTARDLADGWADGVMRGVGECARAYDCPVVGGDTTRTDGPAVVGVTVLGRGEDALNRAGGVAGDLLLLSGDVGWAAAGLRPEGQRSQRARRAQTRPHPRLDLLSALAGAHAAVDISDGLLADAAHLAEASQATLIIDRAAVVSPALRSAMGTAAEDCALAGGEDYEILALAPTVLPGFRVVGRAEARGDVDLRWSGGEPVPSRGRGWDHGAAS